MSYLLTNAARVAIVAAVCCTCCRIAPAETAPPDDTTQTPDKQPTAVPRESLRQDLLRRVEKDQEVRTRLIQWMRNQGPIDSQNVKESDVPVIQEMREIDTANRTWLKKVVEEAGWPVKSQVGKDGANAAWLLLQHADDDPQFQAHCLALMKQAPAGEVDAKDVAMLTDRVMVKQTGKQLYGTQVKMMNGQCEVIPLAEPDRVDQLRQQVGFPPLAEYLKFVEQMYTKGPAESPKDPAEKPK